MRVVVQRVKRASVSINNKVVSNIEKGFLLLVGISLNDSEEIIKKVCDKICKLRIFEDENGKINLDIKQVNGSILSVSQFTLYANVKKGNRPSFNEAAKADEAKRLYNYFNECIRVNDIECKEGVFQEDMKVELLNDGPVTIIVDSNDL